MGLFPNLSNLGYIRAFMILSADTGFPDDGVYTGLGWSQDGWAFGDDTFHFVGMNNGTLEFALSALTGKAYFAGGAAVLDSLGATFTGINYFLRFDATNGGVTRRRELGTFLPTGSSTPAAYDWFGDPTENTNLQTNGDFELGNLNNFDAADSTTPTWTADTGSPYDGTYAALLTTTDDADGSELQTNNGFEAGSMTGWTTSGTATFAASGTDQRTGSWCAKASILTTQTGTITTNLGGTPRMAVTAGLYYRAECWNLNPVATWTTKTLSIKWYTATSGGSLISTDTLVMTLPASGSYQRNALTALAPATAAGAEMVISLGTPSANTQVTIDDTSFKAAQYGTLTTNLGATPRMAVTAGNSYQFSIYSKTDTSGSGVWDTVKAEINWYTLTSGGSLVSTETVPLSLGTSYANTALPFTCPATAAGATIVITAVRDSTASYDSTVLAYFDNITFAVLTVSRYIKFLPNVTIEGGPLDFATLGAAASTPASGIVSTYGLTADKNLYAKNSAGDINVLTTFQAVATPNSDATVDFQNIPQTGHDLHITGFMRPETDDVALFLRLNNYSGASDYTWQLTGSDSGIDNADSEIHLVSGTTGSAGVGNAVAEGVTFNIVIPAYTDTAGSMRRGITATVSFLDTGTNSRGGVASGFLLKTEAVTRVTLLFESGDIAEGKVRTFLT